MIASLDALGFSPAVMQSNNDFGVASTFSVNAHGWPVPFSGCGSTVRALTMVLADGTVVTCSRTENAELFRHAMGGYGLFGVITELELDMRPNALLAPRFEEMSGLEIGARFAQQLASDPTIQMAYGRMDVALDRFFERALLITYRPTADQSDIPAASGSGFVSRASRYLFRAQVESDRAKRFRWWTEAELGPRFAGNATRNSLMNEPVVTLDDRDPFRTDILHEYFVAPARFAEFVKACQAVIPASYQQLLNITLRFVNTDRDSVLAYAPEPRIAAVLLFSQEKTVRGENDMARMTQALIERVLDIGGTYYLPVPAACVAGAAVARLSARRGVRRRASARRIPTCCSATSCGTAISPSSEARGAAVGTLRRIALVYMVILLAAASLNYIPGLTDAEGRAFGVFALDIYDDALHVASALWAGIAACALEPRGAHLPPLLRPALSHRRPAGARHGLGLPRPRAS